ncbi:MAG: M48 family metallopeptidase [Candidatus Shapirobacteria bacterium]|jgi:Zn-dependent protease with chaperone function
MAGNITTKRLEAWMYRAPNEHFALIVSIFLLIIFGLIFSSINFIVFLFLLILGLIYIQLTQAQYIGNAVKVTPSQFAELYDVFNCHTERLNINSANLYIKQDPYLNAFTVGLGTCSVVLTSSLVEQLSLSELDFVIGHELGHFQSGHTVISSLINPLGGTNPLGFLIFGIWSRVAEYTSDRAGLILCNNIDSAVSSMIKLSVGGRLFGRFNAADYVDQIKSSKDASVKFSETLLSHPLTTNRIRRLLQFWRESFTINS